MLAAITIKPLHFNDLTQQMFIWGLPISQVPVNLVRESLSSK